MSIKLENILQEKELKKLSASDIKNINEAIIKHTDGELAVKQAELEKETSEKFDTLVEGLSNKFDEQVTNVIVENAKSDTNNLINEKLYNIVKGVVNLLENSGITTTEKTKELQEKLIQANNNLEQSWHEREVIKEQLSDAEKENYILGQLKGMNPEIVVAALEQFKDKDILDVQAGLKAFINGDFEELDLEKQDYLGGDLDLDQVEQACSEIRDGSDKRAGEGAKVIENNKNKIFESLGKGIQSTGRKIKSNGPDTSMQALAESADITETDGPVEEDAQQAMEQIDDFNSLGLNFNSGS